MLATRKIASVMLTSSNTESNAPGRVIPRFVHPTKTETEISLLGFSFSERNSIFLTNVLHIILCLNIYPCVTEIK